MSWITAGGWTLASACLTLALVQFGIWFRNRSASGNRAFALLAVGVALYTIGEMELMRAGSPERFGVILRWQHIPIFMMLVGLLGFVASFFRTGRAWLAHTAWTLNLVTLVVGFVRTPNADYRATVELQRIPFLGEAVSVARGAVSGWHWVTQLSFLLAVCFVADAAWARWRKGDEHARWQAASIGGTVIVFVGVAATQAALVFTGVLPGPELGAVWFFPVLMVMGWELSSEVVRAARLTSQLQATEVLLRESEERMRRAAMTAQQLSRNLIDAQEDERRRIARELHDDFGQRLALMALDVDSLRRAERKEPAAVVEADEKFERLSSEVRNLSSDLHALSHQLHPAKLDQLGLTATARAWCRDLAKQTGVAFEFVSDDGEDVVRDDEAVCLYRILQEATRNIIRHSGATTARVTLHEEQDGLHLVVEDTGRGFNPEVAGRSGGLGLVSMRERVRSLNGRLTLDSTEGHGTRLEAVVPLRRRSRRPRPRHGARMTDAAHE